MTVGLIVLSTLIGNVLYTSCPKHIHQCFAIIDDDNANDSWPGDWKRMEMVNNMDQQFCGLHLNSSEANVFKFKNRYYFVNESYIETDDWLHIYPHIANDNIDRHPKINIVCIIFIIFLIIFICTSTICKVITFVRGE
jgi:hypothetical protein